MRAILPLFLLTACGEIAWNTKVAEDPAHRAAILSSVIVGKTTEDVFAARWGNPTQKIREGGQVSYVYRDMANPPGVYFPQYGESREFVIVTFQYGVAINAYSNETEGCRATFPPRPPGPGFDTPSTVYPVNCPPLGAYGTRQGTAVAATDGPPMLGVTPDVYQPGEAMGK